MGLSEKEYINALNQFIEDTDYYVGDTIENDHGEEIAILRNLIKEYFELKERHSKILDDIHDYRYSEHANKMIVRNLCKHFGVNSVEELQNIYLNKPYKFMDLKKGMCVWDKKEKEYIPIIVILSKKDCEYRYHDKNKQVFISWLAIEFEEDRFYPREVKENETT